MFWIIGGLAYIAIGSYLSYRARVKHWDSSFPSGDNVLPRLLFFGWPFMLPLWCAMQYEGPMVFTPKWFADRKLAELAKLEKARKALVGETEEDNVVDMSGIFGAYTNIIQQQMQQLPQPVPSGASNTWNWTTTTTTDNTSA